MLFSLQNPILFPGLSFLYFCLERYQITLQADGARSSVGAVPAPSEHRDFYRLFW